MNGEGRTTSKDRCFAALTYAITYRGDCEIRREGYGQYPKANEDMNEQIATWDGAIDESQSGNWVPMGLAFINHSLELAEKVGEAMTATDIKMYNVQALAELGYSLPRRKYILPSEN